MNCDLTDLGVEPDDIDLREERRRTTVNLMHEHMHTMALQAGNLTA